VAPVGWRHPSVLAVQRACAPLVLGTIAVQLNLFVTIRYAAMLGEGKATEFNYGSSIAALAAAIIGPSLAEASFPSLSASSAAGDRAEVRRQVTMVLQSALVLSAAMSGLLVALAPDLVALLFAGPRFPPDSVARAAAVLRIYGVGMVTLVLPTVLARFLYAERAPRPSQLMVAGGLVVNVACQPLLASWLGLPGVAASLVAALSASMIGMMAWLSWRYQALDFPALGRSAWRSVWTGILVAVAAAAATAPLSADLVFARTIAGGAAGGAALLLALAVGDELQMRGRLIRLIDRRRR
jgi:putative peptidoglycan lipid II flippase